MFRRDILVAGLNDHKESPAAVSLRCSSDAESCLAFSRRPDRYDTPLWVRTSSRIRSRLAPSTEPSYER